MPDVFAILNVDKVPMPSFAKSLSNYFTITFWAKPFTAVILFFMQFSVLVQNVYNVIHYMSAKKGKIHYHKKDVYIEYYQRKLRNAHTYKQWSKAALTLDELEGHSSWKLDPVSKEYDYKLLQSRIDEIQQIRASGQDRRSMTFALRLGLSRNLGDMGNAALFSHTRVGTKKLISDYTDHIIEQLEWISDTTQPSEDMDFSQRHAYFMNLRHSYGRTALLLSGGGTLGFFHIGVLKTLVNSRLLPRIISGASSGSIMASVVCTLNEEGRIKLLNDLSNLPLCVFFDANNPDTSLLRLNRYMVEGNLYDPSILRDTLRSLYGDMTFQEAYNLSRLVLNVTVSSSSIFDMPQLLNYITAPDMVIWSAVIASCAVPLVYPEGNLYIKDKEGKLKPWTATDDKYRDGSIDNDLPLKRISEMFSVNHFLVVQVNPHIAPLLHKGNRKPSIIRTGINFCLKMIKEEIQHICHQLNNMGYSSPGLIRFQNVLSQRYVGDITLVPKLTFTNIANILSNLDYESFSSHVESGERATWEQLSKIHHSLKIELAIDCAIYKLRRVLLGESPQIPDERPIDMTMTSTIHLSLQDLTTLKHIDSLSSLSSSSSSSLLPSPTAELQLDEESIDKTRPESPDTAPPITPSWQTSFPYLPTSKSSSSLPNKVQKPPLLPHDISRHGGNASIHKTTSPTRFERRKQVTSAQFFIAPEFDWKPQASQSTPTKSLKTDSNKHASLSRNSKKKITSL